VSWAATVRNAVSDSHKQPVEVEELLRLDGPWTDAIARHATAVRSAWHLGDRLGQANALNNLGIVRLLPGDFRGAAGDLEQALVIYRDIGDREGQAEVLNETGTLHRVTGEPAEADACHQQALELARAIGSTPHEAHALRPPQRSACDWLQHAPKLNRSVPVPPAALAMLHGRYRLLARAPNPHLCKFLHRAFPVPYRAINSR
jgi:tetratricopeptide (TPR) repeat protein